jgi:CRP-like cAMP-binding protein
MKSQGLRAVPVFAGVDEATFALLEQEARPRTVAVGECVVREGERGSSMYIIQEGRVEVVKRLGEPDEVVLAVLKTGDFFGEMSWVEPLVRAASVRAVEPTELRELKASALHHLYTASAEQFGIVVLNLARDLSRRLRRLDEAYAALSGQD